MQRHFNFAEEEYFHIYNRGTDKRTIYENDKDYERFLESLYLFNTSERIVLKNILKKQRFVYKKEDTLVDIGAYCLMPNHFHILVRARDDSGVSIFMKKLQTAYSMYFNKKNKRGGSLFQGPFKAEHITRDEYLKYLFSYIHLNPVKIIEPDWREGGISNLEMVKKYLDSYKYSSYGDYINPTGEKRPQHTILNKEVFPDYFKDSDFDDFINFWLLFKDNIPKIS